MTRGPFEEVREEDCPGCEGTGWVEDAPVPDRWGPYYRSSVCWCCNGLGRLNVSYWSLDEADLFE